MYRALTWLALEEGVDLDDEEALAALTEEAGISLQRDGGVLARGQDVSAWIRTARITQAVSTVAGHAEVRTRILPLQRAFPEHAGPVVAEGRDMGTVVFPEAAVKVFLEADPAERARRRLAQGSEGRAGDDVARMQARLEARIARTPDGPWRPSRPPTTRGAWIPPP